ncbi:MAG: hypothetical protein ACLQUY_26405 [Ktedonobacterales bacterium]
MTNQPSPEAGMSAGIEQGSASVARLPERWLALVRVACVGVSLVALVIWVWGLPLRYAQLGTICTVAPANCGDQQITPALFQLFKVAGVPLSFYAAFIGTVEVLYALTFLVMGALLILRKSDTRIGLLTAVLLITYGVAQTDGDAVAAAVPALAIPANLLTPFSFICLALFLYLFPDGRFVPRWIRWVVAAWILLFLVVASISVNDVLPILFGFLFVSLGVQIYRYRRVSNVVERQQTKWVVFGVLLGILGSGSIIVAGLLLDDGGNPAGYSNLGTTIGLWGLFTASTLIYVFSACIPLSIGLAILRSRLWDIDTLINKALVYGSLTALLAALYAGLIIGLERLTGLFAGQAATNPVILVVSTLAIAALFQPLRTRLQSLIDRGFYRKKYDAEKTLAAFSATLGQEVDLEQIREELLAVVTETMQPTHVSLWLRLPKRHADEQAHQLQLDG